MTDILANHDLITDPPAAQRYDTLAQAIHWLSLLAIATAFIIGLSMEDVPRGLEKTRIVNLHASFGVLLVALTVTRLAWRVYAPFPAPLPGSPMTQLAMKTMDMALYLFLLAIPITGILMMGAKDRAFDVFGLATVTPMIAPDKAFGESLEEAHQVLAYVMLALVCMHAAAACFHHVVLKDSTLARMLPLGWVRLDTAVYAPPASVRHRSDPIVAPQDHSAAPSQLASRNGRPHARHPRTNDRGGRE